MTSITISKQSLYRNDEDYSECVCLLLPDGHATLIDARHFEWLASKQWYVMGRTIFYIERTPVTYQRRRCGRGRTGYGNFRQGGTTEMISLHQAVFAQSNGRITKGMDIDHRNRSPFDNRSANLRPATRSQNLQNTGPRKNKSSQYKGVSRVKGKDKWIVQIKIEGKRHYIGTFDDEFHAAQAYNAFVRKNCPEFGFINPLSC